MDDFKLNMECIKFYLSLPFSRYTGIGGRGKKVATKYRYLKKLEDIGLVDKKKSPYINQEGKRYNVWRRLYRRIIIEGQTIIFE